jgi:hypothetical protein
MSPNPTRLVVAALVAVALAAGAFVFARSFRPPEGSEGRETNVADAPAGGRTQAMPDDSLHAGLPGGSTPVVAPADPFLPGITEAPDVPATDAHRGLKKIGDRIRDAVLADGVVGDAEVPGVEFAATMPQAQRRWFVETAPGILCGCGCGQDLLECRRDDLLCPLSPDLRDSLMAVAARR